MTLQTERLRIRELIAADIPNIHQLLCLPETDEFNTLGIPDNLQTTESLVNGWLTAQTENPRNNYVWCIQNAHDKNFIGLIALTPGKPHYKTAEVWYKIHVNHYNNGYTTEALNSLLAFAFNHLKLHRIEAGCAVENIASYKVLEKAGMKREGIKRKKLPVRGKWLDNYFYAILEEDFYVNSAIL